MEELSFCHSVIGKERLQNFPEHAAEWRNIMTFLYGLHAARLEDI
jgi:hypothetical protein